MSAHTEAPAGQNGVHTPGPWSVANKNLSIYGKLCQPIILAGETEIARCPSLSNARGDVKANAGETAANARLIASAPELLEAAQECDEWLDLIRQNYPDMAGLIRGLTKARAAIAKATGR